MFERQLRIAAFAAASSALFAACTSTSRHSAREDDEVVLKGVEELPQAVRDSMQRIFMSDAPPKQVSREVEHGQTRYEIEFMDKGRVVSAIFGTDGALLELEREIPSSELPKSLTDELAKRFPGAKIGQAETIEEHALEVHLHIDGQEIEIVADATGHIETVERKGRGKDESDEVEEGEENEEHEKGQ